MWLDDGIQNELNEKYVLRLVFQFKFSVFNFPILSRTFPKYPLTYCFVFCFLFFFSFNLTENETGTQTEIGTETETDTKTQNVQHLRQ